MAVGRAYLLPPLSCGGASLARPWLRFHIPLIEPDWRISRIRLSDPCLPRLLPAGAVAGWALHPLEKRRLVTAHVDSGHSHRISGRAE